MKDKDFKEALKSRLWLNFKDGDTEREYHKMKEESSFKKGSKQFICLIIGSIMLTLASYLLKDHEDKETLGQNNDPVIKFHARLIYLLSLPVTAMSFMELGISKGPSWLKKLRGVFITLSLYRLISEPHVMMFSSILPVFYIDRVALVAVAIISIQGNFYFYSWILASLTNFIGVIFICISCIFRTQLILIEYIPLFILGIILYITFYLSEKQDRRRFLITLQYQKQEKQLRELLNKLPTGVILTRKSDKKLIYYNNSVNEIFNVSTRDMAPVESPNILIEDASFLNDSHNSTTRFSQHYSMRINNIDIQNDISILPYLGEMEEEINEFVARVEIKFTSIPDSHSLAIEEELKTGGDINPRIKYLEVQKMEIDLKEEGTCMGLILRDNTNEMYIYI